MYNWTQYKKDRKNGVTTVTYHCKAWMIAINQLTVSDTFLFRNIRPGTLAVVAVLVGKTEQRSPRVLPVSEEDGHHD